VALWWPFEAIIRGIRREGLGPGEEMRSQGQSSGCAGTRTAMRNGLRINGMDLSDTATIEMDVHFMAKSRKSCWDKRTGMESWGCQSASPVRDRNLRAAGSAPRRNWDSAR